MTEEITPEILLNAYAAGYFPMAESRHESELYWFNPPRRGIIPLDGFHTPRKLARLVKQKPFEIRIDTAFDAVMRNCAQPRPNHPDSWINSRILILYGKLHRMGYAHSVECWQEKRLVGGVYGVSLGGAFFGESMFSKVPNASKVALVHLVARLRAAGYQLFDTQFVNDHLKQFGVIEIRKKDYLALLEKALNVFPNPSTRFLTASPITS